MSKLRTKLTAPCGFLLSLAFLLFTVHCSLFTASAQTTNATLNGIVEDSDGKAVPGVKVTITNSGTGLERTIVTDENGAYVFPLLPPATYTVLAEASGFRRVSFPDIILNVGDRRLLRIDLQVGEVGAEVLVNPDDAFLVNTTTAVGTTIDRTFVGQLPLNGRSFQSLILLTPGVTITTATGRDAGQFSVNGQRASTNVFLVDGVGANVGISSDLGTLNGASNAALSGITPGTSALGNTATLVSVDALEEFKIQTSSTAAEFGRQPGAQVSLVTRSGKDRFSGSLFEYFRNEAMDARNYFNKVPATQPALRQNIFGGTFSGPIFLPNFGDGGPTWYSGRKRTFFFFSYEGQRLKLPKSGVSFVPSARLRNNTSGVMTQIMNAFPTATGSETTWDHDNNPNTAQVLSGWAPFNYAVSDPSKLDATSIRIDHAITGNHALFGRYSDSPSNAVLHGSGTRITDSTASTRTLTVGLTSSISAQISNEFRFNHSRSLSSSAQLPTTDGGAVPLPQSAITPREFDQIGISLSSFGGQVGGFGFGTSSLAQQNQLNLINNLTVVRGKHQFKFGGDYRRLSPVIEAAKILTITFSSESQVTLGTPGSVRVLNGDSARPRFTNLSFFAQDTWRLFPRLTLDLGLRYDLNPAPTERDGKRPVAVLGVTGPHDVANTVLVPAGTPFYKTFYTAFAPRFGAAYQLRAKQGSETVVRGGFGVYYDLGTSSAAAGFPLVAARNLSNVSVPFSEANVALPPVVVQSTLPITAIVYASRQDLKLPYSYQWNVGIEQSLGANQAINLSYVGSAGRQLLTLKQLNEAPAVGQPRPNPNFNIIVLALNGPSSDYNSMQAQYKMRLKRGIQALVNYTWSHAIDEVSADLTQNVLERGNASFDVRHNFSGALHYDFPRLKTIGFVAAAFRDWAIDAIVHAQSGRPLDITGATAIVEGERMLLRPNLVLGQPLYIDDPSVQGGRRFNTAAFSANVPNPQFPTARLQGNFGRNVMRELPIYQTDLSLGRTFPFSETVKLQLKADAFNVFNHPHFAGYNTTISSSNFGVPTTTLNSSLGGLSQLYQIGGPRSIQLSARLTF